MTRSGVIKQDLLNSILMAAAFIPSLGVISTLTAGEAIMLTCASHVYYVHM